MLNLQKENSVVFKLNKAQKQCVETLDGTILVLSGAGTGKTRVIISRFIKMIENDCPSSRILCITFSNKAANEIIKRLEEFDIINPQWVGTFHSICFKLLQIYGNLKPNTSIIDEYDQKKIAEKLNIEESLKNIQNFKEGLQVIKDKIFLESYEKYQDYIEKNNYLDFGEIILRTLDILEKNPEIKEKIQERFEYIMVDEYQDTSKLQDKFIQLINRKNLFCVGDDDQSIYSWRGACIENILKFSQNYKDVKIFRLEQNYRCSQPILTVANHLINQNKSRIQKQIWCENPGQTVLVCSTKNEGDIIAKEILKLQNESVGILVRTTSLVKNIENSLIKFNINYKILGGLRFFEKPEIKTAIAYLKVIFLEDILSIERVLQFPKKGIGQVKIQKILELLSNGSTLISALISVGQIEFANLLTYWQSIKTQSPTKVLRIIWEESGCADFFEDKQDNFQILLNKIENFSSISHFLESFFSMDVENEEKVSIMTVHGSKGLEFDNVFIPGLIEGVFPNAKTLSEGSIEEERRLAYVAITRAKKKLVLLYNLSNTMSRDLFGPSRFLFNLPKTAISFITN